MIKIFRWTLLLLFPLQSVFAQTNADKELLTKASFEQPRYANRQVSFGFGKSTHNPAYYVFGSMMYFYQKCVSEQLSTTCAYSPSCSAYSKRLIGKYGLAKGVFCSADRLMRCNRIALADKSPAYFDNEEHRVRETTARYRHHR